ncbi:membrane-bound lytic murein transglycosylase MltF [Candidatus Sulfurimonas marisnigri]|uniref:Membrane-bound lytic murein transglycosylase MltF n=1 Tax=Candidatus Sulfurimonas marisnigri TaxID=2740405 RepID=A0A7S7RQB5_9BACT|nr:membrane-bound lytic murein transglycosylase MltF [Candidatus Sulfurimonas marisnigri]QOY54285.1 membrane-bound lytic murein transglycosylase MltF [Candidatus Sulfurimonas marisnigri]
MDKYIKFSVIIFLSISFFIFGWLSHTAYKPVHKIEKPSVFEKIKKTKLLNVVLLNSPSTYYIGPNEPQGFEYDLLNSYATSLGVELNITTANTTKEAIELSRNPNIHITSASLAKTKIREKNFNFGPSYFEVQEQVVCYRGMLWDGVFPKDVEDLAGLRIIVGEDTSYSETIQKLQEDGFDINASYTSEFSTEELLEKVASNEIDCTIADSNIYSLNQRYFPNIALAFAVSNREQLAWVLAPNSKELEADMYSWLNGFDQSGEMARLKDHYYSFVQFFDYYNTKMLYKRIKSRLPKYRSYFKEFGKKYNIPCSVLAAQSYQESHWNPKAKSFTGVRGLMMLTLSTAKQLGVKNRLDPKESVKGGARHLNQMIKNVPQGVEGEDRLKFALAAYNIGMGHVKDAQILAKMMGLNQNVWNDLKKALPLLSQKKYYKKLKHGYARGSEPVKYVDSIYDYRGILENVIE